MAKRPPKPKISKYTKDWEVDEIGDSKLSKLDMNRGNMGVSSGVPISKHTGKSWESKIQDAKDEILDRLGF